MAGGRRSPNLILDLNNFEEESGSRYVLTSPRSLEACALLRIRPVELLPKSPEEVAAQHPGVSAVQLDGLCGEYEEERGRRLRLCRELREKLVRKEWEVMGHRDGPSGAPKSHSLLLGSKETDPLKADSTACPTSLCSHKWAHDCLMMGALGDGTYPEVEVTQVARELERGAGVTISQRDKKIAALMLAKHRDDELAQQRKARAQIAWQDLVTQEKRLKEALNKPGWFSQQLGPNQRRTHRTLYNEKRVERTLEGPVHEHKIRRSGYVGLQTGPEKKLEMSRCKTDHEKCLAELWAQQNLEPYREMNYQPLEERMARAFKIRLMKELQNKKNLQVKNQYEKLRHTRLKEKADTQAQAEQEFKRMSIQQKEQRSQEHYGQLVEERNKGLKEKAAKEEEQIMLNQIRAEQQEREKKQYKALLAKMTDRRSRHAKDSLIKSIQIKAERTKEINSAKQRVHKLLKQKVEEEDENHKREIEHGIRKKDLKSDRLLREKVATIEEGKKIANASFQMREKIRERTKCRTFDQMARQAELNASLLRHTS
ncbi:hypothetical protein GDO86_009109 [Hymenochirus boettgeri]|uniref:Coiled-coil domain containing 185 n=1 Tax=Hymenochirus boettgeri TaxID=247094 RepID=A0A8T2JF70_9PIPI|nr:hypothetical protein GDO86_009109 [Hymenochirus boettgeri]